MNYKIFGFIFGLLMFAVLFMAAVLSDKIGLYGWLIMVLMFFASLLDNISRKCFKIAKEPRLYIVPITRDMIDDNGNLKTD